MAKQKFTLTSDLVKVEPEPMTQTANEETIIQSVIPSDKKIDKEKEAINFKVSMKLKRDFQVWCISHGRTMSEVLEEAMEKIIKE